MATMAPVRGFVDVSTAEAAMQPTPIRIPSWRWCVSLMDGARLKHLGFVRADDHEGAIRGAMKKFQLGERQQRRVIVWREVGIRHG
jgi:hypothetical protein